MAAGNDFNFDSATVEAHIQALAARLAELPTEYHNNGLGQSGLTTPVNEADFGSLSNMNDFSLFSAPYHFEQTGGSAYGFSLFDGGRDTDTPCTWPTTDRPVGERRCSMSWDQLTPAFFGGQSYYQSTDSGVGMGFNEKEIEDWKRALRPPVPGSGYVCRICHSGDHYVVNCPRAPPPALMKTPYQGYNKCFGVFICEHCGREWGSRHSFAQRPEFCRECCLAVYPHKQYPLDKIPQSVLTKLQKSKFKRPRSTSQ